MYIGETNSQGKYTCYLLRESYREDGKVKHRTIANLSHCSKEEIEAMRLALKHKRDLLEKSTPMKRLKNKANSPGRDCLPCLRRDRLASLRIMTGRGGHREKRLTAS